MDGDALLEAVRADCETELTRLGSDKALLAATNADLETGPVLAVLAGREAGLRDAYREWAEAAVGDWATAFESAAERADERVERVLAAREDDGREDAELPESGLVAELREIEAEHARAGAGLVGAPLVGGRIYLQAVSFFVNEADENRADLCRDLRTATEDDLAAGLDVLDARCGSDNDWERAQHGATEAIRAAYDEYAAALDAMGMDPRPIC